MAEKHDVMEIEASLRLMLNMQPADGKHGGRQGPAVKEVCPNDPEGGMQCST